MSLARSHEPATRFYPKTLAITVNYFSFPTRFLGLALNLRATYLVEMEDEIETSS